jgi:CheY-like chemotaxis protein
VLVVEANVLLRATLCEVLADAGFQVSRAANIPQALQVLRTAAIDVILMDYPAGGLPARTAVSRLRDSARGVPITIITGDAGREDWPELDVADVIENPFENDDLIRRLREVHDRGAS